MDGDETKQSPENNLESFSRRRPRGRAKHSRRRPRGRTELTNSALSRSFIYVAMRNPSFVHICRYAKSVAPFVKYVTMRNVCLLAGQGNRGRGRIFVVSFVCETSS
jgi:hypothetical protein